MWLLSELYFKKKSSSYYNIDVFIPQNIKKLWRSSFYIVWCQILKYFTFFCGFTFFEFLLSFRKHMVAFSRHFNSNLRYFTLMLIKIAKNPKISYSWKKSEYIKEIISLFIYFVQKIINWDFISGKNHNPWSEETENWRIMIPNISANR